MTPDDSDTTNEFLVSERTEAGIVVSIWGGFGNHVSAVLSDEQVSELIRELGGTPNTELGALVGGWEYDREQRAGSGGYEKAAEAYRECAQELRELMEEHE